MRGSLNEVVTMKKISSSSTTSTSGVMPTPDSSTGGAWKRTQASAPARPPSGARPRAARASAPSATSATASSSSAA